MDPQPSIVVWTHNHLLFMQEIQLYFTKLTIISLGINDACLLVSLIPMDPAESAYLSHIERIHIVYQLKPPVYF